MSYSTSACVGFTGSKPGSGSKPGRSSRKSISPNALGGAAAVCLVLACGWTVYANILRADVYPMLGSANYDAPVIRRSAALPVHQRLAANESVTAVLDEPALRSSAPATLSVIPSLSFHDRFAASAPQSIAPASQPEPPKLAEVPRSQSEPPKLTAAVKTKEPAHAPVQVAAIPTPPEHPAGARSVISPGDVVRGMAQRAKAAVMSLASNNRQTMVEKLWGKQPSNGPLLAFASADVSVTGSVGGSYGQNQNPALGGSAPYDRSTAVYDISAHMVYLPDGARLEAHSGLGDKLDDPSSANIRMHGVTPPHIYELKPRETLFHGVPALRLTPIGGDDAIFGRTGLLAHTFMLGPNGDSNGCVSFRDYDAFLNAYRNQGIKRLAVVAKID
jgi:hypothetical protein